MQFGNLERALAARVNAPRFRRLLKTTYIFLNAFFFSSRTNRCVLHGEVEITDVFPSLRSSNSVGYYDVVPVNKNGLRFTHRYDKSLSCSRALYIQSEDGERVDEIDLSCASYQQGSRAFWWKDDQILVNQIRTGQPVAVLHDLPNRGDAIVDTCGIGSVSLIADLICTVNYDAIGEVDPAYGYNSASGRFTTRPKQRELPGTTPLLRLICMRSQRILKELTAEDVGHGKEFFPKDLKNYVAVTHAQFCPSGRRLAFLVRWLQGARQFSEMRVLDCVTGKHHILLDAQIISHYCWMSEFRILYWGRSKNGVGRYKIIELTNDAISLKGSVERSDGHPTPVCANAAIVDEYPDRSRMVSLSYLHFGAVETGDFRYGASQILSLQQPLWSRHERRVDCHPRFLRTDKQGKIVFNIDSAHTGCARNYDVSFQLSDGDP